MFNFQFFTSISRRTVPRVTPNVVAASRRRGYRQGADESKWWCYLLCIIRVCTPACV